MKKILLMIILVVSGSCGPHRMACGPRGICDAPSTSIPKKTA
ncbi:hypothetical protein [Flavobacterium sp.]|nr:hypothetical protein [Flavobacterium sp.]